MGSNRWMRNSFVYLLVIIGIIVIFYTLLPSFGGKSEEPLTTVVAMAKNNEIREIEVDGKKLTVYPKTVGRGGDDRFEAGLGTIRTSSACWWKAAWRWDRPAESKFPSKGPVV
jgi:hypothetical protein